MLFIIQFEDVYAEQPERLPERTRHMPEHLAFSAERGDRVVAAGALRPSENGVPSGGIWMIDAEDKAAAEVFCKDDPFWKAGLRKSVRVNHRARAFWSSAFTDRMEAFGAA